VKNRFIQVGLDFALRVLVGMAIGILVDVWLESQPVGVLVGFTFGMMAAARLIWHVWQQGLHDD
jgi:F0F1-type ATP synthase assembly protein I